MPTHADDKPDSFRFNNTALCPYVDVEAQDKRALRFFEFGRFANEHLSLCLIGLSIIFRGNGLMQTRGSSHGSHSCKLYPLHAKPILDTECKFQGKIENDHAKFDVPAQTVDTSSTYLGPPCCVEAEKYDISTL
jgi:hypothetical protein